MVSQCLEDYEVLNILGEDTSSSCYKVKNKINHEVHIWRALSCEGMSNVEINDLFRKISHYQKLGKNYLMKINGHIHQKDPEIIYLITEYCSKGSLTDIINHCIKQKKRISEDFIWKFIYQITFIMKTMSLKDVNKIMCSNVFVNKHNNIKIFSFNVKDTVESADLIEPKVILGQLLLSLCTLELTVKEQNCEIMCDTILDHFSNELVETISFILKKQTKSDEVINAILCHPTVLFKSSKESFNIDLYDNVNFDIKKKEKCKENTYLDKQNYCNEKIKIQLENLKNREMQLKNQEQKIMEKEFELKKREKKVILLEKLTAEKYSRAELYLKTAKENRTSKILDNEKPSYTENTDASFSADCGDTSILPTSSKLNLNNFKKPQAFSRTFSERHVRFKGHSPLKETGYRKSIIKSKQSNFEKTKGNSDVNSWQTLSSESNSEMSLDVKVKEKKKSLFPALTSKRKSFLKEKNSIESTRVLQDSCGDFKKTDFRPISWTEDNKKQAFQLLKIINSANSADKENIPVKHTKL